MNITIKIPFSPWVGKSDLSVLIDCTVESKFQLKVAIEKAVKDGANLTRANLDGANLDGANLTRANLYGANLTRANLYGANLTRANLCGANLDGANLDGANLDGANLTRANLDGANLYGANLDGANLDGANLDGANLDGANLTRANLTRANLTRANLDGATNANLAKAMCLITPDGDIIGWKRCQKDVIVKLLIPKESKRHNATGRKCRAEYVTVLEVFNGTEGVSSHDGKTKYSVGQTVRCDIFEENRFQECAGGIHFFLTRIEAENYR